MSFNRTGSATFWSQILSLVNGEIPSKTLLYDGAIHKLHDNGLWLASEIVRRFAKLASTSLGTKATLTGSVDLRGLVYDQVSGAVNGLGLQLQTDTSSVATVTFSTGSTAPGAPGDIATAINGELGAFGSAYVNDSGLLVLQSATTGGSGTIEVLGGSALSVLGLTATTATGSATGGDGFSQVSGAAVTGSATGTIPAGTLRSVLQWLADRVLLKDNANQLNLSYFSHGVAVTGPTVLDTSISVHRWASTTTAGTYTLVLDDLAADVGNPAVWIRFDGVGNGVNVYVTNPANAASPTTAYYGYLQGGVSVPPGGYLFIWDETRWRIVNYSGAAQGFGGGSLA